MAGDWTDNLLEGWAASRPAEDMSAYRVTARIARLGLHIARSQERVFGKLGLNRGDVGVLSALEIAGPPNRLSPTQLFKGLMLSSAGVTSRLDRLEKLGLVSRERHPHDRRGVLVELTRQGRAVLMEAVGANTAAEQELIRGLDPAERSTLADLLKKLLTKLEPNDDPGA